VNKGVGCTTCHGQVDRMPLMWQEKSLQMEWCLDCHRNPERYVRPREAVFRVDYTAPPDQAELGKRLVAEYQIQRLTSCSTCHR
jgi:Zn ribbon nucleic-acid-binding protein